MLGQINILGRDKVQTAIKRFQTFEPPDGYYLTFSGGKDSVVIKALADMAGVKYDAHYCVTSVDPPELVQFIKEYHKDVVFDIPRDKDGKPKTMWNVIPRHSMPPTRLVRYCCQELKEGGGTGRFVVTGVRWAESTRRKETRSSLEIDNGARMREREDADNPNNAEMARYCPTKGKHILNPIIDWGNEDVWEFIRENNLPYCKLYDEGYKRLGCIGCPMGRASQLRQFERWPKYKEAYVRTFDRMLEATRAKGKDLNWQTGEEVMEWWLHPEE